MSQPLSSSPPWWPSLRDRAHRQPASPRADLRVDGRVAGSVAWPLVELLVEAGLPLVVDHRAGHVAPRGDASDALGEVAAWLHRAGHAGRWRDEPIAVRAMADVEGPVLAVVERAAVRNLGIHTRAVQLHAREPHGGGWWLQQRALDKATDPGKWDTITGGLVAAGESVEVALERESWEEAGVRLRELAAAPVAAGRFTVRRPVDDAGSHGYLVETVFAFACALAPGQLPRNQDGEVLRFECVSDAGIDRMVATGELTLEAAVAVALCRGVRA